MFSFDFMTGMIQFYWIRVSILDVIFYIGALIGLYKHYRAYMKTVEAAIAQNKLKEAEVTVALAKARREYIISTARDKFHRVEALALASPNKVDDKLAAYIRYFVEGMTIAFEDPPSDEEIRLMRDRALALSREDHIAKGEIDKLKKTLPDNRFTKGAADLIDQPEDAVD